MLGYIYTITNNITKKVYVGQTIKPKERWLKHKNEAKHIDSLAYKSHLYNSMNAYGIDNFSFEIIDECDCEILDERERYWIQELHTLEPNGYNISNGGRKLFGEENPFYGKHHSEETKQILSAKNTGRKATDEERKMRSEINKGVNNPFYGKQHSDEIKRKIKESNIKNGNYEKASDRMRLHNPNDGSFFSKAVVMLDANLNILNTFESAKSAGDYIKAKGLSKAKTPSNSISDVCRELQKSAYGFYWRYINPTLKTNLHTKTDGYIITKHREEKDLYESAQRFCN